MRFCRNGMAANWDDLKVLLAISRVGSLTLAAEVLGIDQSTCGRRLTALEAALGAILFLRSKTGLTLTEAGETAVARAVEIEARMERLTESLTSDTDGPAAWSGWSATRGLWNAWPGRQPRSSSPTIRASTFA